MMKQRKTTVYKKENTPLKWVNREENTWFSDGPAAYIFAAGCATVWMMSVLEVACGSLQRVFQARSFGEILNLFMEHRESYLSVIHKVYAQTGGAFLTVVTFALAGGFAAFCFLLALRRGGMTFFTVFAAFAIVPVALQLWLPSESVRMTGLYFLLIAVICVMRGFGRDYKRGIGFLCILLMSGALLGIAFGTQNAAEGIEELRSRIETQKEEWLYGGRESGMSFGSFYEDKSAEKDTQTVLRVTMSSPRAYYLRGYTGNLYTKDGWKQAVSALTQEEKETAEENTLFYQLKEKGFSPQTMLAASYRASGLNSADDEQKNVIQVLNIGASRRYLYLPYEAEKIEASGRTLIGGGLLPDQKSAERYAVTTMPYAIERYGDILDGLSAGSEQVQNYRQAESNYRDYVLQFDMQIPDECYQAVAEFFLSSEEIKTSGEAKTAILKQLSRLQYDETVTDRTDDDFVESFLKRGSGYDKHFAAAAVMAFRYYGIPARFTEGYLITPDMAAGAKAGEEITVTAAQAHCWAEYYEAGVGWLPFETTPPYIGLMKSAGSIGIEEDTKTQPQEEQQPDKKKDEEQDSATKSEVNYQTLVLLWILLLIILAAVIWALRRKRKSGNKKLIYRPRRKEIKSTDRRKAIIALLYFIRKKEGSSQPSVQRPEIEEIYLEARYSTHEMSEEKYQKVLRYYYGLRRKHRKTKLQSGGKDEETKAF